MRALVLLTGFLALLAAPAWANWENTRWGMTPEQVAAASHGEIKAYPANKRRTIEAAGLVAAAGGTHKDGTILLDVEMTFDIKTNGLACVSYATQDPKQNALLRETLIKRFGTPENDNSVPAIGMQDTNWSKPDSISLTSMTGDRATVMHCQE